MIAETHVMENYRKKLISYIRLFQKTPDTNCREVLKKKAHTLLLLYLEEMKKN